MKVMRYATVTGTMTLILIMALVLSSMRGSLDTHQTSRPLGVDYGVFYSGSQAVLTGKSEALYDETYINESQQVLFRDTLTSRYTWAYPPSFLLFTLPFALVNFNVSLALWLISTFVFMVYGLSKLFNHQKVYIVLACGFSAVILNLMWGQNAFLTTGLYALGLSYMDSDAKKSGVAWGLLCFKPHLALVPLMVLGVQKKWQHVKWTLITLAAITGGSALLFGPHLWSLYLSNILGIGTAVIEGLWSETSAIQPSLLSALRLLEVNPIVAMALQVILALILVVALLAWWSFMPTHHLSYSALVVVGLLVVPYYMIYDLVLLTLPFTLLFKHMSNIRGPGFNLFFTVLWVSPILSWLVVLRTGIQVMPLVLAMVLGVIWVLSKNQGVSKEVGNG